MQQPPQCKSAQDVLDPAPAVRHAGTTLPDDAGGDRIRSGKSRSRLDAAELQSVVGQYVFTGDELRVFRASLGELPEAHRQALVMNRLEGLSTAEIGRRLGGSEGMIRRHIVQALIYCRHRISGLTPAEAGRKCMHDESERPMNSQKAQRLMAGAGRGLGYATPPSLNDADAAMD